MCALWVLISSSCPEAGKYQSEYPLSTKSLQTLAAMGRSEQLLIIAMVLDAPSVVDSAVAICVD